MTSGEKKLIRAFALHEITQTEFLSRYPIDIKLDDNYIFSMLKKAYEEQNPEDMEYSLMLLPFDGFENKQKYITVLNGLLLEGWHQRHEDIASLLKGMRAPESVDVLYKAALIQYDYLEYDDTYQLARKCIKALATIGGNEAIAKLKDLSNYTIPEIADYARKELGYLGFS